VIEAMHDEHNIFKMGGLRRQLPLTFWTFLIGAASLSALPLVSAGFYSKDLILWSAWSSPMGSASLWGAGLAGALLTSLYTFRMVFLTFFGPPRVTVTRTPGYREQIPLVVLAFLSIAGGFVPLTGYLQSVLPATATAAGKAGAEVALQVTAALVSVAGILVAYLLYLRSPQYVEAFVRTPSGAALQRFWFSGWGFDWLYDRLFVWPYVWLARADRSDVIDLIYAGIAGVTQALNRALSRTETGRVRWYAAGIGAGAILIIAIVVFS
jgi:NADH-quinone oxidoreductase subunit L